VTSESCTKVADLSLRRLQKTNENIGIEITAAISFLKDAERLLLRAHIAMEDADWDKSDGFCQESLLKTRKHAKLCEDVAQECHDILMRLCDELGYDDPFSTESSSG
jgi:hypothetical protein